MIRTVTIFLLCFLAGPVWALSCVPHDVKQAYRDAAESDASYVVVRGELTFDQADLPVTDWDDQFATKADNFFSAHMRGLALGKSGFNVPFEKDLTVNVQCAGPWCGGLDSDHDYLVFLKKRGQEYLLETDPCGGFAFFEPSQEMLEQVRRCFRGGRCKPAFPR